MNPEEDELNRLHEFMREEAEAREDKVNRDVYSVYVTGWEGSMRVWYAPEFDTYEQAQEWIDRHEWDEGKPRVELVYDYSEGEY
jgi:hypothetical protein